MQGHLNHQERHQHRVRAPHETYIKFVEDQPASISYESHTINKTYLLPLSYPMYRNINTIVFNGADVPADFEPRFLMNLKYLPSHICMAYFVKIRTEAAVKALRCLPNTVAAIGINDLAEPKAIEALRYLPQTVTIILLPNITTPNAVAALRNLPDTIREISLPGVTTPDAVEAIRNLPGTVREISLTGIATPETMRALKDLQGLNPGTTFRISEAAFQLYNTMYPQQMRLDAGTPPPPQAAQTPHSFSAVNRTTTPVADPAAGPSQRRTERTPITQQPRRGNEGATIDTPPPHGERHLKRGSGHLEGRGFR